MPRISPAVFAARGIAPVGYALFAFVLGVAVGIVLRRTVVAMAVTLVAFAAVMVAVPFLVRPYMLPALTETVTISESTITQISGNAGTGVIEWIGVRNPAGAWVLTDETVDPSGNAVSPLPDLVQNCLPGPGQGPPPNIQGTQQCVAQLNDHGYTQHQVYQPGYRFWPLQWIELAFFLALSALLTWFCFRRLRHVS
jgi:hypothetical protein